MTLFLKTEVLIDEKTMREYKICISCGERVYLQKGDRLFPVKIFCNHRCQKAFRAKINAMVWQELIGERENAMERVYKRLGYDYERVG